MTERVYDGYVKVDRVDVDLGDGKPVKREVVRVRNAVAVLCYCPGTDEFLFTKQFRIGANAETLEVPAGCIDGEEDPVMAAIREVQEETGRKVLMIRKVGEYFLSPGYTTEKMFLFSASVGEEDLGQHLDGDEFLTIVPMKPRDMLKYGFQDIKTQFLVNNFSVKNPSWFSE